MSSLLTTMQRLVAEGKVEIGEHAYRRLVERGIDIEDVLAGFRRARLLEDCSSTRGVPRLVVEQEEADGAKLHVVWELDDPLDPTTVLVTAFRPAR